MPWDALDSILGRPQPKQRSPWDALDGILGGGSSGGVGSDWESVSPILQRRRKPDDSYEYRPKPHDYAPDTNGLGGDDRGPDPGWLMPSFRRAADAAAGWTVGMAERAPEILSGAERAGIIPPAVGAGIGTALGLADRANLTVTPGTRQEMRQNLDDERDQVLMHGNANMRALALGVGELGGGVAASVVPGLSLGRAANVANIGSRGLRVAAGAGLGSVEGAVQAFGDTAGMATADQLKGIGLGAGLGGLAGGAGAFGGRRSSAPEMDSALPTASDIDPGLAALRDQSLNIAPDINEATVIAQRPQPRVLTPGISQLRDQSLAIGTGVDSPLRPTALDDVRLSPADGPLHTSRAIGADLDNLPDSVQRLAGSRNALSTTPGTRSGVGLRPGESIVEEAVNPRNPLVVTTDRPGLVERIDPALDGDLAKARTTAQIAGVLEAHGVRPDDARQIAQLGDLHRAGIIHSRIIADWAADNGFDHVVYKSEIEGRPDHVVAINPDWEIDPGIEFRTARPADARRYDPAREYVTDAADPLAEVKLPNDQYKGVTLNVERYQSTTNPQEFSRLRGSKFYRGWEEGGHRYDAYKTDPPTLLQRAPFAKKNPNKEGGHVQITAEVTPTNPLVLNDSGTSLSRILVGLDNDWQLRHGSREVGTRILAKYGIDKSDARVLLNNLHMLDDRLMAEYARSRGHDFIVHPTREGGINVIQLYPESDNVQIVTPGTKRIQAAADTVEAPVTKDGPNLGPEAVQRYTQQHGQIGESVAQEISGEVMAGNPIPPPDQILALRDQRSKELDATWHDRVSRVAATEDDVVLRELADNTEVIGEELVAPPEIEMGANPNAPRHIGPRLQEYIQSKGLDPATLGPDEIAALRRERLAQDPDSILNGVSGGGGGPRFVGPELEAFAQSRGLDSSTMELGELNQLRREHRLSQGGGGGAGGNDRSFFASGPKRAPHPMSEVIQYDDAPKIPVIDKLRKAADNWVDHMSDKEDAPVRLLRRAGLKDEANVIAEHIGRSRGASVIAKSPIYAGVRMYDPVTNNTTRIHDSYASIVGGLDGKAEMDLNNLLAARHHMELVDRQSRAQLEYDMARAARLNDLKNARLADKSTLRSVAGDIRDQTAEQLRLARREAKARGEYGAYLHSEQRAARVGSRRRLLSPMEENTDLASGRAHQSAQDLAGGPKPHVAIQRAQRAAMVLRDQAVGLRRDFPPVEPHPDANLHINERGTELARQTLADLETRYGTATNHVTGERRIARLDDVADRVRSWSVAAVIDQLDSIGYFKPGMKDRLLSSNREYAPFFRLLDELADDPNIASVGGTNTHPIERISGGLDPERRIAPPLESFVSQAQKIAVWVEKQRVKNLLGDLAEAHPDMIGEIKKIAPNADGRSRGPGTFMVLRDGVRIEYSAPVEVLAAFEHVPPNQANYFLQAGVVAARMLRAGATLSPDFAVRNLLRDQMTAGTYGTKFGYKPFADFAIGLWAQTPLASKELRQFAVDFEASGAGMSDHISANRSQVQATADSAAGLVKVFGTKYQVGQTTAKIVNDWRGETNVFAKLLYPVLAPLEMTSGAVEKGTRIGAYRRGKLAGASDLTAGNYSRNITLDFGRSGSLAQRWNSYETFFNAGLQDIARFSKAMRDPKTAALTTARAFALVTAPTLAAYYAHKDDPAYQSLPEWEKAAFIHVSQLDDGRWIRVPRPQGVLNLVFGYGVQQMLEAAQEKLGPEPVNELLTTLFQETPLRYMPRQPDGNGGWRWSMEALPTAAQPVAELAAGEGGFSEFRRAPIVPAGMQEGLLPADQKVDTTTATAQWIGRKIGDSPIKVDYLIRSYGAGLTVMAINAAEKLAGVGPHSAGGSAPELPMTAKDIPGIGGLISTSPYGFASKPVTDLYQLQHTAAQAYGSLKLAEKQGRVFEWQRIRRENPEAFVSERLTEARRELKEFRDLRKSILQARGLTPEQRLDRLLVVDQAVTQYAAGQMHFVTDLLRGYRKAFDAQAKNSSKPSKPKP